MTRRVDINDIKKEALEKYDLTLLSTEYTNNRQPLEWLHNKSNTKFTRDWKHVKAGSVTPVSSGKRLTTEYVKKEALDRWGFILISSEYKNNAQLLAWLDSKTGNTFLRSWGKLISGSTGVSSPNTYEKDKIFFESYKNLGYTFDMTREEYLNAPTQSGNKIFHLTHPDLDEAWDVKKGHFKTCAETHLNNSGKSTGELYIESILSDNKIIFEEQKKVYINGNLNLFDFYLPDYNLYIEYDGKQHYLPIKRWGGKQGLLERQRKDAEKNLYVANSGSKMLRIPYTVNTVSDIADIISKEIGTELAEAKVKLFGIKQKIVDYYESHSSKETAEKFHITTKSLYIYYRQVHGYNKIRRQ